MGNTCYKYCDCYNNEQIKEIPLEIKRKDLPKYIPNIKYGRVIEIYDGDTFTLAAYIDNGDTLYQVPVRINGIDCPEMKTKNENEKKVAEFAKQFVTNRILYEIVYLKNVKLDKYGRILADVTYGVNKQYIGFEMIEKRLAVAYDGGTKYVPNDWLEYYNN